MSLKVFIILSLVALLGVVGATFRDLTAITLPNPNTQASRLLDRNGILLTTSRSDGLNTTAVVPLHKIPPLLRDAAIIAEDKRFLSHGGVDWLARVSAVLETLYRGYFVRGASTITEQTVRIIHPRRRTIWSRWLEGLEASALERKSSKGEILEFYLNQLPYGAQRRGVAEAAQYYFDRDLDSLSRKEQVALAIIPRAPRWFNPKNYEQRLANKIDEVVDRMVTAKLISEEAAAEIKQEPLRTRTKGSAPPFDATHFASYVMATHPGLSGPVTATLDSSLQSTVQRLLDRRIKNLTAKKVTNGAVLVLDHRTKEILAYSISGVQECYSEEQSTACSYDAVQIPRQPGSAMKPFLYSLAMEKGWTPATIIRDEPLSDEVGAGLHRFKNYSHIHYGDVTLRQALGNSLNIPAVLAIQHAGVADYFSLLKKLHFDSLNREASYYDVGLALGAGEVTLFELVRGYAALASGGVFSEPILIFGQSPGRSEQVLASGVTSIVADILSDKSARELEFGSSGILNLPVQTAVKTGTSTDFRDSWAVGFDSRYAVGIWMGNLDSTPTDGLTGSTGPALLLRSVFNELHRQHVTEPLSLSADVQKVKLKVKGIEREELMTAEMVAGVVSDSGGGRQTAASSGRPRITFPTNGLMMAYDPRVPAELQEARLKVAGLTESERVSMEIDGQEFEADSAGTALWRVSRGKKRLVAKVRHADGTLQELPPVEFLVR